MTVLNDKRQVVLFVLATSLFGCGDAQVAGEETAMERGDPAVGKRVIREVGCGSCHVIPGVESAQGMVGPPLDKLARRAYLAGILPNNYHNLVLWIEQPQEVAPRSAMPDMNLTAEQATDIAAYLYTLK